MSHYATLHYPACIPAVNHSGKDQTPRLHSASRLGQLGPSTPNPRPFLTSTTNPPPQLFHPRRATPELLPCDRNTRNRPVAHSPSPATSRHNALQHEEEVAVAAVARHSPAKQLPIVSSPLTACNSPRRAAATTTTFEKNQAIAYLEFNLSNARKPSTNNYHPLLR